MCHSRQSACIRMRRRAVAVLQKFAQIHIKKAFPPEASHFQVIQGETGGKKSKTFIEPLHCLCHISQRICPFSFCHSRASSANSPNTLRHQQYMDSFHLFKRFFEVGYKIGCLIEALGRNHLAPSL